MNVFVVISTKIYFTDRDDSATDTNVVSVHTNLDDANLALSNIGSGYIKTLPLI